MLSLPTISFIRNGKKQCFRNQSLDSKKKSNCGVETHCKIELKCHSRFCLKRAVWVTLQQTGEDVARRSKRCHADEKIGSLFVNSSKYKMKHRAWHCLDLVVCRTLLCLECYFNCTVNNSLPAVAYLHLKNNINCVLVAWSRKCAHPEQKQLLRWQNVFSIPFAFFAFALKFCNITSRWSINQFIDAFVNRGKGWRKGTQLARQDPAPEWPELKCSFGIRKEIKYGKTVWKRDCLALESWSVCPIIYIVIILSNLFLH